jgi:hypothetical protein
MHLSRLQMNLFRCMETLQPGDGKRYATNLLHPLPESGDNVALRCVEFNSLHAHMWSGKGGSDGLVKDVGART